METETRILSDQADQYLMEMISNGEYERLINGMIWYGSFSLRNQALIQKQIPWATDLKGMRPWNYVGRYIKNDEKGVATLSPIFEKKGEAKTFELTGFKVNHLFDISQTEGREYHSSRCQKGEIYHSLRQVTEGLEDILSWRTKDGSLIKHSLKEVVKSIKDDKTLSEDDKIKKLVSNVSSKLLRRKLGNPTYPGLKEKECPNILEIMTSAVEHITYSRFQIGEQELIFPDIANYTNSMTYRLRENLGMIRTVSQSIINAVESTITLERQSHLKRAASESFEKLKESGALPFDTEVAADAPQYPNVA